MFTEECVIFDLETTGLSPTSNEIIEIGAIYFKDGVAVDKFSRLVKPICSIPSKITQLTGITNEMVENEDNIKDVLPEFYDFCKDYPLVAYNLPFDSSFLINKGNDLGIDFMLDGNRLGMDALEVARRCFPNMSHKLTDMIDYLKIQIDTSHRAFSRSQDHGLSC